MHRSAVLPSEVALAEFQRKLTERLHAEYHQTLVRFGREKLVQTLAAGRCFRARFARCVAGADSDTLLQLCAAFEMMHTSTLVHDDIIDRSDTRRNIPTVWRVVGVDEAILIGNIIAMRAFSIAEAISPAIAARCRDAFARVNDGQLRELVLRGVTDRSAEDYYAICRGKTSAMFELPLHIGAVDCPLGTFEEALTSAVSALGIAFQIVDDNEDVTAWLRGPEEGRSKGGAVSDVDLGNHTLPVMFALMEAGGAELPHRTRGDLWARAMTRAAGTAAEHLDHVVRTSKNVLDAPDATDSAIRTALWLADVTTMRTSNLDSIVRK